MNSSIEIFNESTSPSKEKHGQLNEGDIGVDNDFNIETKLESYQFRNSMPHSISRPQTRKYYAIED